jgi:hypothetical protein
VAAGGARDRCARTGDASGGAYGAAARRHGVESHGRLGVVYANQDYGCEWDYDWKNKRFRTRDNTMFAVNLVVYAMT